MAAESTCRNVREALEGAGVRPGTRFAARIDHRNLLATIQDVLGLPRLPSTRGLETLAPLLRG